jgi:L-xylulose reductase
MTNSLSSSSVNPTIVVNDFRKEFWIGDEESRISSENLKSLTPLKRFAEIEDVLNAILFLMSDRSSMITGESLMIDGGFLAR